MSKANQKKSDAEKRAQARYDEVHKAEFKNYHFKFRIEGNEDIIEKLETVGNKQDYIRQLILTDIESVKNGR